MPYRSELPPSWWWYDTIDVHAFQVEDMVRTLYPEIFHWLVSQTRHDWWFEWNDMSGSGHTILVTVWVVFFDIADAALFRLFFAGSDAK